MEDLISFEEDKQNWQLEHFDPYSQFAIEQNRSFQPPADQRRSSSILPLRPPPLDQSFRRFSRPNVLPRPLPALAFPGNLINERNPRALSSSTSLEIGFSRVGMIENRPLPSRPDLPVNGVKSDDATESPVFYSFDSYGHIDTFISNLTNYYCECVIDNLSDSRKDFVHLISLVYNPVSSQRVDYPPELNPDIFIDWYKSGASVVSHILCKNASWLGPDQAKIPMVRIKLSYISGWLFDKPDEANVNGQWIVDQEQIIAKRSLDVDPHSTRGFDLIADALLGIDNPDPNFRVDASKFRLRILGRMEFINPYAHLSQHLYIRFCHRMARDIHLVLEPNNSRGALTWPTTSFLKAIQFSDEFPTFYRCPLLNVNNDNIVFDVYEKARNSLLQSINKTLSSAQFDSLQDLKSNLTRFTQSITAIGMSLCTGLTSAGLVSKLVKLHHLVGPYAPTDDVSVPSKMLKLLYKADERLASQINAYRRWMQVPGAMLKNCGKSSRDESSPSVEMRNKFVPHKVEESASKREVVSADASEETLKLRGLFLHWALDNMPIFKNFRYRQMSTSLDTILSTILPPVDGPERNQLRQLKTDFYYIRLRLMYAGRPLELVNQRRKFYRSNFKDVAPSQSTVGGVIHKPHAKFPSFIEFQGEVNFGLIRELPRETLISINLLHTKKPLTRADYSLDDVTLVAWVNVPLYDDTGALRQGRYYAGLWPVLDDICPGMRTMYAEPNRSSCCPVLEIVFPEFPFDLRFPKPNSWIQAGNLNFTETLPEDCGEIDEQLRSTLENAMCAVMFQRISCDDALRYRQNALESFRRLLYFWKRGDYSFFAQFPSTTLTSIKTDSNSEVTSPMKCISFECQLPMPHQGIVDMLWAFRNLYTGLPNLLMSMLMDCLISWPSELATQCDETSYGRFAKPWHKVLDELYSLMSRSRCPKASMALWLLGPGVADQGVRHWAVRSLATCSPDSLLALAPQLIQLMNYDLHFDWSGLFSLLVYRSSLSVQFASGLYWYLVPLMKHGAWHSHHRSRILLATIKELVSPRITKAWSRQMDVIEQLNEAAIDVKDRNRDSERKTILNSHLQRIDKWLKTFDLSENLENIGRTSAISLVQSGSFSHNIHFDRNKNQYRSYSTSRRPTKDEDNWKSSGGLYEMGLRMPFNLGLLSCSYFNSFTKPLKLVFKAPEPYSDHVQLMYKVGDDLRLDALICQILQVMDEIWLNNGLDLRMIHFKALPTGPNAGIIELVPDCFTLKQIQDMKGGIKGPFQNETITRWLEGKNLTEGESNERYLRALETFMLSTVACCVGTYILGLGDRHNENIMLRTTGHMFHIDFAKVFGNGQKFMGINRDRVPFVFTQDMYHVIQTYNALKKTENGIADIHFENKFTDTCCKAYNILRDNMFVIFGLLETAIQLGVPTVGPSALKYLNRVLQPTLTPDQAKQHFFGLIKKTLDSRSTQMNFLFHNLANPQGGTQGTGSLSSKHSLDGTWRHSSGALTSLYTGADNWQDSSQPLFTMGEGSLKTSHMRPSLDDQGYMERSRLPQRPASISFKTLSRSRSPASDITPNTLPPRPLPPTTRTTPNMDARIFSFTDKIISHNPNKIVNGIVVQPAERKTASAALWTVEVSSSDFINGNLVKHRILRSSDHFKELMDILLLHFPKSRVNYNAEACRDALDRCTASEDLCILLQVWLLCIVEDSEMSNSDIVSTFLEPTREDTMSF